MNPHNPIDPSRATHTFLTARTHLGRNLTVPRECAEKVYAHFDGPVYMYSLNGGGDCPNCRGAGRIMIDFCHSHTKYMPREKFHADERGGFWQYHQLSWNCPVCAPENKAWAVNALLERCGVIEKEWDTDSALFIGDPNKRDGVQAVLDVIATLPNPAGFVTLMGDYGSGKTRTAKGAVVRAAKSGIGAFYIEGAMLLEEIKATYSSENENSRDVIRRFVDYPLLVIDEIDTGEESQWAIGQLRVIINRRYENRAACATILISNKTQAELMVRWAFLVDRMKDGVRVIMRGSLRGSNQLSVAVGKGKAERF